MVPPQVIAPRVPALDCEGRTIWIVDAHRDDGKRFVVHTDEKTAAFMELELLVHGRGFSEFSRQIFLPIAFRAVNAPRTLCGSRRLRSKMTTLSVA